VGVDDVKGAVGIGKIIGVSCYGSEIWVRGRRKGGDCGGDDSGAIIEADCFPLLAMAARSAVMMPGPQPTLVRG